MHERPLLEGLYREHRSLRTAAADLQQAVSGLAADPAAALNGQLQDGFWRFQEVLLHHFRQEEKGLYPEAQRLLTRGAGRGDVFGQFFAAEAEEDIGAHAAVAARVVELLVVLNSVSQAQRLEAESSARVRTLMGHACGLLLRHADKEDRFIYPMLQQALDYSDRQRVRQRLLELG